jgi:hypothetical protein
MFKNPTQKSWFYKTAVTMPPLRHTVGLVFDIEKSEVINWILAQPGMKQYIFKKLTHEGGIVFDQSTGCWRGKEYRQGSMTPTQAAKAAKDLAF